MALSDFLQTANYDAAMLKTELKLHVRQLPKDIANVSVTELVMAGMPVLDAIYWKGSHRKLDLVQDNSIPVLSTETLEKIAKGLFLCRLFLLVYGRYPRAKGKETEKKVTEFVRNVFNIEDIGSYEKLLASFPIDRLDPIWIRRVSFNGLDKVVLTELGLRVFGFQMLAPFAKYECKNDAPSNIISSFATAVQLSQAPPDWALYCHTRDAIKAWKYGDLNANLGNLMLDCLTTTQLEEMVEKRLISRLPSRCSKSSEYLNWVYDEQCVTSNPIFPETSSAISAVTDDVNWASIMKLD